MTAMHARHARQARIDRWRATLCALVGVAALAGGCNGDAGAPSGAGGATGAGTGGTAGSAVGGGGTVGAGGGAGTGLGGDIGSGMAGTTGGGSGGNGGNVGSGVGGGTAGASAAGRGGTGASSGGASGGNGGRGGAANAGTGGGTSAGAGRGGTGGGGTSGSAGMSGRGGGTGGSATGGGGAGGSSGAGTLPYKGVANSPCAARTMLGVTWYYNWTQTESEPCSNGQGGQFVPMIWGHTGSEQSASGIASSITSFVNKRYGFVLGFNEPDNPDQSNVPVATAISLWPSFNNPAIKIGTPGTAANATPGQAWYTSFMNMLNADTSLRADFMAIHWYGWNAGSCDAKASQLESYIKWAEAFAGNRPIWITEWGCLNQSAPDVPTVVNFFNGAVAMFAKHPRVERYAWYPWATNHALVDSGGALTALGMAFAAAPATK